MVHVRKLCFYKAKAFTTVDNEILGRFRDSKWNKRKSVKLEKF